MKPRQPLQNSIIIKRYQQALRKLADAESKLEPGTHSPAADKALQEVLKTRDAAIKAGLKVQNIPETKSARLAGDGSKGRTELTSEEKVKQEMDRANISDNSGLKIIQTYYPNTTFEDKNFDVEDAYLYVEPANAKMRDLRPGSEVGQQGIQWGGTDKIRNLYQKQLMKIYGSHEALYNKLYQAKYIKAKKMSPTTGARDILNALELVVADYSLAQVNDYKDGKVKGDFPTMDAFLSSGKRAGESLTKTNKITTIYDDTQATELIRNLYQKLQKRDPNAKELKELIPMVQDFQKKNPQITTSTKNEEGTFQSSINKLGGDPEEFLLEKLSQKDETKARSILGYYDVFKSAIGVQ